MCAAGRLGFTGQYLEQQAPSPHSQAGGWVAMQGHEQSQILHCSSRVEKRSNTLVLVLLNVAGKPEITGQKGCREPLNYLQREWPSGSTEEEAVVLQRMGIETTLQTEISIKSLGRAEAGCNSRRSNPGSGKESSSGC